MSTTLILKDIPHKLLDAVDAVIADGETFALPALATIISWQTIFGTSPNSVNIELQASLDGTSWETISASTNVNGELKTLLCAAPFIRAIIDDIDGGDDVTVLLTAKVSVFIGQQLVSVDQIPVGTGNNEIAGSSAFTFDQETLLVESESNFVQQALGATSDGQANVYVFPSFIAASGDKDPFNGAAATPGQLYALAQMRVEYVDTTDPTTLKAGFRLRSPGNLYAFSVNRAGDVGIGSDNPPTSGGSNLFVSSVGNVAIKGTVQPAGYKSSDGTAGATAGPFTTITSITVKNGLVTALVGS